jgi:hypothetical protein
MQWNSLFQVSYLEKFIQSFKFGTVHLKFHIWNSSFIVSGISITKYNKNLAPNSVEPDQNVRKHRYSILVTGKGETLPVQAG